MASEFTGADTKKMECSHCGRIYFVERAAFGFTWDHKGHKGYCSNRCMQAAGGGSSGSYVNTIQDSADTIRREAEEKEALMRDREKAEDLKQDGKKWLALWYYIGAFGRAITILVTFLVLFFGIIALASGGIGFGIFTLLIGVAALTFFTLVIKEAIEKWRE